MPLLLRSRPGAAPHSSSPLSPNHRRHSDRAAATVPSSSHGFPPSPPYSMSEYRHNRSSSVKIAAQSQSAANMGPSTTTSSQQGGGRFEGPRSPPNTSHVPCKFFRQGACQAGSACPFSHDLGSAAETVCKYFAKGNCKFGPKCANVHVLADGRRINYGKNGISIAPALHLGNRVNPTAYTGSNQSALTHSFLQADAEPEFSSAYGYSGAAGEQYQGSTIENGIPTIDAPYTHESSQYGSLRDEDSSRFGLGLSPLAAAKGLSVLDAPLPASFDSNGVSHAARHPAGPWPSSVPSQFGVDSPSPSLTPQRDGRTSEALKLLHHSAFGGGDRLSATVTPSSPPNHTPDEYFGKRQMHSSRFAKPKLLSSSAPRSNIDRDWESEFQFLEEDYVPDNLRDLLTPAEKARRGSRAAEDEAIGRIAGSPALTGLSTPGDSSALKFGSPMAGSPSRWGPSSFQRPLEDFESRKAMAAASAGAFGHVGSPLRNSSLSSEMTRLHNGRPGSMEGVGALSQQLQRTRIDGAGGESPRLHPHSQLTRPSNGRANERHVSSSSISSSARYTTPIGEDDGEFAFAMDEDIDRDTTIRARKRTSGVGTVQSIWGPTSYAGAASGAGKKDETSSSKPTDAGAGR